MKTNANSFVLSAPSWVIPGTYADNLRFLENTEEVQGVELLFFIYNDEVKAQLDSEWEEIRHYSNRFVFTAHLPELLLPHHSELIARLAPLVRHFITHPSPENPAAQTGLLKEWTHKYNAIFLTENTNPGLLEAQLPHMDDNAGLCMDTGHLLLEGKNPAAFFAANYERIREIHLHAVDRQQAAIDGRLVDHRQLRLNEPWLLELLPLLENYRGIINIEVFSWEEAEQGVGVFKKALAKR
jgi:hypothetical protein